MMYWDRSKVVVGLVGIAATLIMTTPAAADPLEGTLTDALTGAPIPGAEVRVTGTSFTTFTDDEGRWQFDLEPGTYTIELSASTGSELQRSRLVNQYVPQIKHANAHVFTSTFHDQGLPPRAEPLGVPGKSGMLPAEMPDTISLYPDANPLALNVPNPIPRRIRVGRRQHPENGCRNNPIIAIEEMDIDEYVKGVLPPEIGVFQSIPGAAEVYKQFAIAAKSYGLWFMLYYDADNRRDAGGALPPNNYTWFHIDDTACNQRYSDQRMTITTDAAEAVANKVLVKKGEPGVLDKLEYAASCATHGTLPEYGSVDALVPDDAPENACAGSWCGHNNCAGHEDNPHVPGDDRCLVRGICQWGSASWGKSGKDYLWMLSHYQPNLELMDLDTGMIEAQTVTVRGFVYSDPADITGSAISTATVSLSDGQSQDVSDAGEFSFQMVPLELGAVTVTASAPGYISGTRDKMLEAGVDNYASIQLTAEASSGNNAASGNNQSTGNSSPGNNTSTGNSTPGNNSTPSNNTATGNNVPGNNTQGNNSMTGSGTQDPSDQTDENPLGPLVTSSPGPQAACQAAPTEGPMTPWALLVTGVLGLLSVSRRRRR